MGSNKIFLLIVDFIFPIKMSILFLFKTMILKILFVKVPTKIYRFYFSFEKKNLINNHSCSKRFTFFKKNLLFEIA